MASALQERDSVCEGFGVCEKGGAQAPLRTLLSCSRGSEAERGSRTDCAKARRPAAVRVSERGRLQGQQRSLLGRARAVQGCRGMLPSWPRVEGGLEGQWATCWGIGVIAQVTRINTCQVWSEQSESRTS